MSIVIAEETIHFDDRPYSIRAYGYENHKRYRVTIPEDYIADQLGVTTWSSADLTGWAKKNKSKIEKMCDQLQIQNSHKGLFASNGTKRADFADGYEIIIT